ncbi:MAG: glycosyltransferase family 2 protein, partial [Alphaproteobacteria bacterium]
DRCDVTLAGLSAFEAAARGPVARDVDWRVLLVDDGSRDGTAEAVAARFPAVEILRGDGSLYWNGATRLAFETARRRDPDFFLWLNDDTTLDPDGLDRLLATWRDARDRCAGRVVVVGATRDPSTGLATYGGLVRVSRWDPLRFAVLPVSAEPVACSTFNGNCVLIPREVAALVGTNDASFRHGLGDFDYGLRCAAAGCELIVAPGTVGACRRTRAPWRDPDLPVGRRWAALLSDKGLPPRAWGRYARRHGGPLWPLFFLAPYLSLARSAPSRHSRDVEHASVGDDGR